MLVYNKPIIYLVLVLFRRIGNLTVTNLKKLYYLCLVIFAVLLRLEPINF